MIRSLATHNPWSLYQLSGYEVVSRALSDAMDLALKALDKAVSDGESPKRASLDTIADMEIVQIRYAEYGAADSEGFHYVEERIAYHLRRRYGVESCI